MLLFNDYGLAFLHINKTGGTSVKNVLKEHFGKNGFVRIGYPRHNELPVLHEPIDYKMRMMGTAFNKWAVTTTIRNPYARFVSLYAFRQKQYHLGKIGGGGPDATAHAVGNDFKPWLRDIIFGDEKWRTVNFTLTRFLNDGRPPSNLVVFRIEEIGKILPPFLEEKFGIHINSVPHDNKTEHKPFMDYYDSELRHFIYQQEKYIIDKYYPEFKYPEVI